MRIQAPPVSDDAYFDDLNQAIRYGQVFTDGNCEDDEAVYEKAIDECEPALPKARKAGPLERRNHQFFDDQNAELTLNLLKISTQEEVKLVKQTNSEFFEELQRNQAQNGQKFAKHKRHESQDASIINDLAHTIIQSTAESDANCNLTTDGFISFEQAMNLQDSSGPFSDVLISKMNNKNQYAIGGQHARPSLKSQDTKPNQPNIFS